MTQPNEHVFRDEMNDHPVTLPFVAFVPAAGCTFPLALLIEIISDSISQSPWKKIIPPIDFQPRPDFVFVGLLAQAQR